METTYDRLVMSAIELMTERSFSGTSVGMLAGSVGVSKSTVIHYFKTKEGILLAILENFFPSAIKDLSAISNKKNIDGVEKLRRFIDYQMKLVAESGDVLTLVIRETKYLGEENKKIYEAHHKQYEKLFLTVIEEVQRENEKLFANKDPKVVMKAILGMCNYATVWYRKNGKLSHQEISKQFFEIITGKNC